jgi:hypothetical protein
MLDFDMDISHNFASFKLDNKMMFIESFDNVNFEVRIGTAENSKFLENITAKSTVELNQKLKEAFERI